MKFYNKCSENSRSQIAFRTDIFQKLSLGAPNITILLFFIFGVTILTQVITLRPRSVASQQTNSGRVRDQPGLPVPEASFIANMYEKCYVNR